MSPTTKPHSLLEDSSKGKVEDPSCPEERRERSSRRTARHASASPKPNPPRSPQQAATSLERHARKCAICNHADRAAIDDDFVSWRSESTITIDYQLPSRSSVYRHAAATGLLQRRRRNLRGVAERIIERVDEAPPTAAAVLRAMRIFAQITEDGQWVEPTKRTIVTHIHITQHSPANHSVVDESSVADRSSTTVEDSSASPSESPVAAGLSRHSETPARSPASHPAVDHQTARQQYQKTTPQHDRKTVRQLDYLPRWAAGLSDAEILIGTQNTDPETVSNGQHNT